jgi:hypothetical protein
LKLARYLGTDVGGVLWLAKAPCPAAGTSTFDAAVSLLAEMSGADAQRLATLIRWGTSAPTLSAAA